MADKIKQQVEFYFSDSNYPRDRFLRAKAGENEEGWIDLSVIGTFSRMKSLTTDLEEIAKAVKDSNVVTLSEDGKRIKRTAPLPEEDLLNGRSIYAKGFPADYTLEQLFEYFNALGKVNSIRMRRTKDKIFKGSVFVEFPTDKEAEEVAAKELKLGETPLEVLTKNAYLEKKKNEKKNDGGSGSGSSGKGEATKKRKRDDDEGDFVSGAIVKFSGLPEGEQILRSQLKAIFDEYAEVAYIDYQEGTAEGYVRFKSAEDAKKLIDGLSNANREIGGKVLTYAVVEGDEEKEYWAKIKSFQAQHRHRKRQGSSRFQKRQRTK